jgi:hypothetical protein
MKIQECYRLLAAVESEYEAAKYAVGEMCHHARLDPTILDDSSVLLIPSMFRDCSLNLEPTFILRLFSEFEFILRDYLAFMRPSPRVRRTRMEILINRAATIEQIPHHIMMAAHQVREFRNRIVHEGIHVKLLTLQECKSMLNQFLSHLPRRWG